MHWEGSASWLWHFLSICSYIFECLVVWLPFDPNIMCQNGCKCPVSLKYCSQLMKCSWICHKLCQTKVKEKSFCSASIKNQTEHQWQRKQIAISNFPFLYKMSAKTSIVSVHSSYASFWPTQTFELVPPLFAIYIALGPNTGIFEQIIHRPDCREGQFRIPEDLSAATQWLYNHVG